MVKFSVYLNRRVFVMATQRAPCKDSNQPVQFGRLIWVFPGCTCSLIWNAVLQLIYLWYCIVFCWSFCANSSCQRKYSASKNKSLCSINNTTKDIFMCNTFEFIFSACLSQKLRMSYSNHFPSVHNVYPSILLCWVEKGSCQFRAKECAQVLVICMED